MRQLLDRIGTAFLTVSAIIAVGSLVVLLGLVLFRGVGALDSELLFSRLSGSGTSGGIAGHLLGTVLLVATALSIAIPVGVGMAIMTTYIRSERLADGIDTFLQALNTIPSIVFGLVGLALIVRGGMGKSWMAGGIVLAVMILPTITIAVLEKIRSIETSTLEAAYGLGLTHSQVVRDVIVPASLGGLVSGALLGLARSAGETAPIMFTAVVFSGPAIPEGIVESPVLALPYHIFVLAQDSYDPGASSSMWGAAVVLLLLVMSASAFSIPLRTRISEESRRG